MKKKELFVLGSGESINLLSKEEREYINNSPVKIAINKFAAFYDKAGIIPTHVYFVDSFSEGAINMLNYIIEKIKKDKIENITLVVKQSGKLIFTQEPLVFYKWKLKKMLQKGYEEYKLFYLPKNVIIHAIKHSGWLEGGSWAKDLKDFLFHFRGSLTTVLNYISICFPGYTIKLIGTDFNSSKYFYDKELKQLNFDTSDWTTSIINKENKHFSAVDYEGTTMFDKFEFIVNNLKKTGNKVYCCNPKSLLITEGYTEYSSVID